MQQDHKGLPLLMACDEGGVEEVQMWLDYGEDPTLEGVRFELPGRPNCVSSPSCVIRSHAMY